MERAWDNKQDYGTMGLSISTGDPITITAYGRGSGRTDASCRCHTHSPAASDVPMRKMKSNKNQTTCKT